MHHLQPALAARFTEVSHQEDFADWTIFQGRNQQGDVCRVVVFSSDLSANEQFRSAWRRDIGLLQLIPHDGVPAIVESCDADGMVYVATEPVSGMTLADCLEGQQLSWDEIADVGWQIASAVQHLHNSGIAHGGLSLRQIRINEQLRIQLLDSAVTHWIALSRVDDRGTGTMNELYTQDLIALGRLLKQLAHSHARQDSETAKIPAAWWELIEDLSDEQSDRFPSTAREVQGRLGGILLEDSGEAMDVVADRTGRSHSRNSIVDEILPDRVDDSAPSGSAPNLPSSLQRRRRQLVARVSLAVIVLIAIVTVWLVRAYR